MGHGIGSPGVNLTPGQKIIGLLNGEQHSLWLGQVEVERLLTELFLYFRLSVALDVAVWSASDRERSKSGSLCADVLGRGSCQIFFLGKDA